MATLLTTSKMAPALAARVEASVRGRRAKKRGPRLVALARLLLVLLIAGAAGSLVGSSMGKRRTAKR